MTTTDLWPDIKIDPKPRGVRQILEEAGRGLKEKTNGVVEFRVWPADGRSEEFPFRFRCELRVEKLDYNYLLLEVDATATGFPVEVRTDKDLIKAANESDLLQALRGTFWSERTRLIIKNLISMATE
jgi:hypothetical protein